MLSLLDIQDRLLPFLAGRVSLDDFEDWLVQNTWDIHRHGSGPAQELAYAIELRLAEYSSGHLSYEELHRELCGLVETRSFFILPGAAV